MRPRPWSVLGLVATAALVVGCGTGTSSSGGASSDTPSSDAPSAIPSPTHESAQPTPEPSPSTPVASVHRSCAPRGDIKITIFLGRIDCASAYRVAARVDGQGEKRQDVGGYVCEFGNAMTRPTIFTCTNRSAGAEFAVDQRRS